MTIGGTIHALRLEKRMPQKSVAQYLNVSVSTVSNYEVDRHLPDVVTLAKIADLFGVSVEYIIGRTKFRHCFQGFYEEYKHSTEHLHNTERFFEKLHTLSERQREHLYNSVSQIPSFDDEVAVCEE